jgi:hypothetical protein
MAFQRIKLIGIESAPQVSAGLREAACTNLL